MLCVPPPCPPTLVTQHLLQSWTKEKKLHVWKLVKLNSQRDPMPVAFSFLQRVGNERLPGLVD